MFTSVVSALGFLAMLFGTVLAANDLVNLQFPNGDWHTSAAANNLSQTSVSPWLLGKSVGVATAGWVLAGVGASLVGKVWPGPSAYYERVTEDEVGEQAVRTTAKDDTA